MRGLDERRGDNTKDVRAGGVSKKKQIKSSRLCMRVRKRKIEERTCYFKHEGVAFLRKARCNALGTRQIVFLLSRPTLLLFLVSLSTLPTFSNRNVFLFLY